MYNSGLVSKEHEMKIMTAITRINQQVNKNEYVLAAALLKKFQRKFGNRKFGYWTRLMIKNGLWETGQI
jgi:hypothetical protein